MKKTLIAITVASTFIAGAILTGCQPSSQKVESAQENVQDAKQELNAAQKEATAEEWQAFKDESEAKIKDNETRIAELKEKMKKSGKKLDAVYQKNIDALEQKNKDMKARIDTYGSGVHSDWEAFKREFNHDMDDLGSSLKNLTVDNKN